MTVEERRERRFTPMERPQTNAETANDGELSGRVIGAFFHVYDALGFGFLESVYRRALAHELSKRGLDVETEHGLEVWYDDVRVGTFRVDLLIERRLIVEIKASQTIGDVDRKQLLNYLRASHIELGLLLHAGPRPSIKRLVYSNALKQRR